MDSHQGDHVRRSRWLGAMITLSQRIVVGPDVLSVLRPGVEHITRR